VRHIYESKSKERTSQNFIKTILEFSGYKVMDFGIEHHNQDIIKQISGNYKSETNVRLMCMPDLVVVDPDTNVGKIVEVKYRAMPEYFHKKKSNLWFPFKQIKEYLEYWHDMTLIIVMNVVPYCLCIQVKDIDWCYHFIEKKEGNRKGYLDEIWNFSKIYRELDDVFPKVNQKHIDKALKIIPLANI
jgi:hypothetical protein